MEEIAAEQSPHKEPGEFMTVAYRCRCGHEWAPRTFNNPRRPTACPKCKTPNWDKPYKFRRKRDG